MLRFDSASNVTLERVDLFGCGINGIWATDVTGLTLSESVIRDCTNGLLVLRGCGDVKVVNTKLIDSKEYDMVEIAACPKVVFEKCSISGNIAGDEENPKGTWADSYGDYRALFLVEGRSGVQLTNCSISKNTAGILFKVDETSSVTASDCAISNNLASYLATTPKSVKLESTGVDDNDLRGGRFRQQK